MLEFDPGHFTGRSISDLYGANPGNFIYRTLQLGSI